MTVKQRIKQVLQEKRISQSELSRLTGMSRQFVSTFLKDKGGSPTMSTLNRIAEALGVDVSMLFYEEPSQKNITFNQNSLTKDSDTLTLVAKKFNLGIIIKQIEDSLNITSCLNECGNLDDQWGEYSKIIKLSQRALVEIAESKVEYKFKD